MKIKQLLLLLSLVVLVSCQTDSGDIGNKTPRFKFPSHIPGNQIERGVIRICLSEDAVEKMDIQAKNEVVSTGISKLDLLNSKYSVFRLERTFNHGGKFEERHRKAGLHLWYNVYFNERVSVKEAFSEFGKLDIVTQIEPSVIFNAPVRQFTPVSSDDVLKMANKFSAEAPFNDEYLYLQWHYNNDGSVEHMRAGADINLYKAWDLASGHKDIIVCVLDGGVYYDHVDIKANMWVNEAELNGEPGVDDDDNGYVDDIHGWNFNDKISTITPNDHGSHVAGTIAAINNNGIGVCGVAGGDGTPNSGVKIITAQIFGSNFVNDQIIANAMTYAADNGAVISQNSWGGYQETSHIQRKAMEYFIENAGMDSEGNQVGPMKGGIIITAAGNDNVVNEHYPAAFNKTLSVASIAPNYEKSSFSNYGSWVDISAPGGDYSRFEYLKYGVLSIGGGEGRYGYLQGTSMACPHVSGVAALVISKFGVGKPGFTPDELRDILLKSVKSINLYNTKYIGMLGSGMIDAYKALTHDQIVDNKSPEKVTDLEALHWNLTSVDLKWSATADVEDGTAVGYNIVLSTESLINVDLENPPLGSIKHNYITDNKKEGDVLNATVEGLEPGVTYNVAIAAVDSDGGRSHSAYNSGKTIAVLTTPDAVHGNLNESIFYNISDMFDRVDELTFEVECSDESVAKVTIEGNDEKKVKALFTGYGKAEITLNATDRNNWTHSCKFYVYCRDNKKEVEVYPNPVVDILNVRMGVNVTGNIMVNIVNSAGIKVMTGRYPITPTEPAVVDMSKLKPGFYSVTIIHNGKKYIENVIKQ